jgi:hypothetical protein
MHLMCCLHCVPGMAMMSLMLGILEMHGHVRGSAVTGHVVALEPCRAVVLVPRSHGDAIAFLRRGAGLEP